MIPARNGEEATRHCGTLQRLQVLQGEDIPRDRIAVAVDDQVGWIVRRDLGHRGCLSQEAVAFAGETRAEERADGRMACHAAQAGRAVAIDHPTDAATGPFAPGRPLARRRPHQCREMPPGR